MPHDDAESAPLEKARDSEKAAATYPDWSQILRLPAATSIDQSAIGNRQSAIPIRNPQSSFRQSAICSLQSAIGSATIDQSVKPIHVSEAFIRRLLQHAHDSIHIVDEHGVSVFDSAEIQGGILGFPMDEVIGRNNAHMLHEDDRPRALQALERIFKTGKAGPVEYRIQHKDGSWRVYETIGQRYVDEDGRVFAILNTRQTTEQHRAREQMRQLELQLRQSQKLEEIGRLAGGIAHDFNNLLSAILGYAEQLEDRLAQDPQGMADLAEIQRAGQRAAQLTRQLLAFSRKQYLHPQVISLNDAVREMVAMLQPILGPDIEVRTRLMDSLPHVRVDPGQMQQVLLNLAVNARDAMPDGGAIEISTEEDNGRVRLSFSDTGSGIPAEMQPHIFEPFFTTKPEGRGTGLGLATVYGILKQSGGDITVESAITEGTRFNVYLPPVVESNQQSPIDNP
jgi:two-component system, cell cycle sensor histidine kinase and response regulator CckA